MCEDVHRLCMGVYMYKILRMNLYPSLLVYLGLEYPEHTYSTYSPTRARNDPRLPLPVTGEKPPDKSPPVKSPPVKS